MSNLVITNLHDIIPRNTVQQTCQPTNPMLNREELNRHLMSVRANINSVNREKEELASKVFNLTKELMARKTETETCPSVAPQLRIIQNEMLFHHSDYLISLPRHNLKAYIYAYMF